MRIICCILPDFKLYNVYSSYSFQHLSLNVVAIQIGHAFNSDVELISLTAVFANLDTSVPARAKYFL